MIQRTAEQRHDHTDCFEKVRSWDEVLSNTNPSPSGVVTMQLSYRGTAYESGMSAIQSDGRVGVGKYRGVAVSFNAPQTFTAPHSGTTLQYRGIPYLQFK